MRPTPLSPDFDPLGFPEGRPAPSGFGGSLHPCCSRTSGARFRGLLGCVAQRPAQLRGFAPLEASEDACRFARSTDMPEGGPVSRSPWPVFVRGRSVPRLAPPHPPEGASSFAIAPPESPRAFRISHPVRRFDPKIHLTIQCRSSGPGAIIRRVSAFPATGGLRRLWSKPLPSLRSPRHLSQVAPFNGLDRRLAAATHDRPSEDRRSCSGHQMRRPIGSLARSCRPRRG